MLQFGTRENDDMTSGLKWLPRVSDDCTGCGQCVDVCDHGCLRLEWSFATLHRPADCGSEATCADVCPEKAIEMVWVETSGDQSKGVWRPLDRTNGARESKSSALLALFAPWLRLWPRLRAPKAQVEPAPRTEWLT
jgi:NAD-dependent dihydropyrimidine dehydrogenase PreA subunit